MCGLSKSHAVSRKKTLPPAACSKQRDEGNWRDPRDPLQSFTDVSHTARPSALKLEIISVMNDSGG